ncbi:MAG TPA: ATP-binding cassette domain-containing protein [Gemmatimonadales bacterium]|nr:ATP-binding cassette domain-containing protein [Gemmatimonadales bacterium]
MTDPPVLAADGVTLTLGGRPILQSAYVDAVAGTITALVGRSGAGKTTLFAVLVGRRRPLRGTVRWAGSFIARPSLPDLAQLGLFFHPDRPWLARQLTLAEHASLFGLQDWRDSAEMLGIASCADQPVGTLSGGQLRLAELTLAVARKPRVALLDEPFRGLEPKQRERVAAALRHLANHGCAVLYADHDVETVRVTADRLFSIEEGATRLVADFQSRPLHEWYHTWPT